MGSSDSTLEQFTAVWETQRLGERVEEFEQTGTIHPRTEPELLDLDEETILEQLPEVSYEGDAGALPEVDVQTTIGKGGMAYVLAANQVPLKRDVAVKRLRGDLDRSETILPLLQEAWITGRLEHPNVIPIYRLGRDREGNPLIVMKRVEGVVWKEFVDDSSLAPRHFDTGDPLDWHLDILAEVCNAVHYAHHRDIIHRDLKPENIMVGEFGEVYVLDWGLAVSLDPDRYTRIPSIDTIQEPAGTPAYMAPEMLEGDFGRLGPRTDVYLLGGLLHYIITGDPPHKGDGAFEVMFDAYRSEDREFPGHINREIARICNRALSRDPADRFESAEAFRQAILEYKEHRQSLRLSAEAKMRLQSFRRLLRGERDADEAEIRALFGECRFGFEQALETSSKNREAREGLQKVLELMIDYELDRGAAQSAALLLADLPEERSDLEERAVKVRRHRETRDEAFKQLKEIESRLDLDLGRHTRSLLALGFGLLWAVLGAGPAVLEWFGISTGMPFYLFQELLVAVAIGGGLYLGREAIFQNEANRNLAGGLLMIFAAEFFVRAIGAADGTSVEALLAQEMMMSSMGAGVMALTLDARLFWAAVPYLLGSVSAAYVPEYAHPINGVANIGAMGLLAWAWWPVEQ